MKDGRPEVRREAVEALREVDLDIASEAIAALTEALVGSEEKVRLEALKTLSWLGDEARRAAPAVVNVLLSEPKEAAREAAGQTLLRIDPDHHAAEPLLAGIKDRALWDRVLRVLRRLGPEARLLRRTLEGRRAADSSGQPEAEPPPAQPDTEPEQYVTLDQAASLVNRSKKTLERYLRDPKSGMPRPDVEGGGGKPHEWRWPALRP
jgi:hypothetical protein